MLLERRVSNIYTEPLMVLGRQSIIFFLGSRPLSVESSAFPMDRIAPAAPS